MFSVVPGVATETSHDHAARLSQFAVDLLNEVQALPLFNYHGLHIYIGINSGMDDEMLSITKYYDILVRASFLTISQC